MNYIIEIDSELKIIRYKHSGNIARKELGMVWQEILKIKEFTVENYGILADYRGARFDFSEDDLDPIWEFLESFKHILNDKRESVIVDDPFSTAITHLFELEIRKRIGFEMRIFCTEPSALDWLLN